MNTPRKIGFFTAFILPVLVVAGFYGGGFWNWSTVAFAFVVVPFLDYHVGPDPSNVPRTMTKALGVQYYYRFVTYLWTYVQLALIAWGCFAVASGNLITPLDWVAFILSTGIVTGGVGITVAHELGHKQRPLQKLYSQALLLSVCYAHFYIEHNRGHHVRVATPDDPATARYNESFYHFWIRSVFGGYRHAWTLEQQRLAQSGKSTWHLRNRMIWYAILPVAFCFLLTWLTSAPERGLGWAVPVYFFGQSLIAFTLLELVNYVEHYGIRRRETAPGKYERVSARHSWNASHVVSNFFLFQLQRHSDHHLAAGKPYQILDHHDDSPQLPFGYPTMVLIALIPPLWFSMMNERLHRADGMAGV